MKTNAIFPGNPIIRHTCTADPTVLHYRDKVYLYVGHDEATPGQHTYVMNEWLCFSSDDLLTWTEHVINFKATDFAWASGDAYASCMVERDGKFYWYMSVTHATVPGEAIGVAVSDSPAGPFKDALGAALITSVDLKSGGRNFDPSVIVDDDGQGYIFWGKDMCYFARLKDSLVSLDGDMRTISLPKFQEGAHLHKRNGWYYLLYGYDFPEKVAYAMSRTISGPWKFKGIVNEIAGNCETNRPGILDYKGQSYFFYHNGSLPDGGSHRRSVCIDALHYHTDGSLKRVIMTTEGIR
jgi:beta-xylosidase